MSKEDEDLCPICHFEVDINIEIVMIEMPVGLLHFYHLNCFFDNFEKVAKIHGYRRALSLRERALIKKQHLCERCFRMMDTTKEKYKVVTDRGVTTYRHQECPPLKEPLPVKK